MKSRILPALLVAMMPLSAGAADYTVSFGEIRGDPPSVIPTTTIKMCLEATGYKFGYQVTPNVSGSFELKDVLHLPTVAKTVARNTQSLNYGRELVTNYGTWTSAMRTSYTFDEGDPLGAWTVDVVVNDNIIASYNFNVVEASNCP